MEHIAALLLVIGCSGDLKACEEIPPDVPVFETRQDCAAELVSAQRIYGHGYDTTFFKCVGVDPALETEDAELAWNITSDGTLHAAVEALDVMVALADTGPRHDRGERDTFAAN